MIPTRPATVVLSDTRDALKTAFKHTSAAVVKIADIAQMSDKGYVVPSYRDFQKLSADMFEIRDHLTLVIREYLPELGQYLPKDEPSEEPKAVQ